MMHWTRYMKIAAAVARKIAEEYPGISPEDIQQEILLQVAERKKHYESIDYPDGQLRKNFHRFGVQYAGRERYATLHRDSAYVYTPSEVRHLFDRAFFRPELWEKVPVKDDGNSVTAGGVVVALWDLDAAYSALPAGDAEVIAKRFDSEEPLTGSEQVRLTRAIEKVTRALNNRVILKASAARAHSGPGSRRVGALAD
ncbi:hypothetical protein [Streptomyces sp. NPDC004435]|uniref:hypothetical protein n=1 Tax=Streptomyces sp. NPDC004435 TaxID=3364701 RepID=UPI0036AAFE9F